MEGPRSRNPGAGIASSVADQLRWARFHLGDGRADSGGVAPADAALDEGAPVACRAVRSAMPSASAGSCGMSCPDRRACRVGERPVRGIPHGSGGASPVAALSNAGPNGIPFNQAVVRWALEAYLGVVDREPEPIPYDQARAREVVGRYDIDVMTLVIATDGRGLTLGRNQPEIRATWDGEMPLTCSASVCPSVTPTNTSSLRVV